MLEDQGQDGHARFFIEYCRPTFDQLTSIMSKLSTTLATIDTRLENIENKQLVEISKKQDAISVLVQSHQDFITSWKANWRLISIIVAVIAGGTSLVVKILPLWV